MSTIMVKGINIKYTTIEDMILVDILNKKICIPVEKVSRKSGDEKKLSVKMLQKYLESSKLVKRIMKG